MESGARWPYKGPDKCKQSMRIFDQMVQMTQAAVSAWDINAAVLGDSPFAAVIVEAREHRYLEWCVREVHHYLGQDWSLVVFHSTQNEAFAKKSLGDRGNIVYRLITRNGVPQSSLTRNEYGSFIMSSEFWDTFPPNVKRVLIFQTDSAALRPYTKGEAALWAKFDYIGSPWDFAPRSAPVDPRRRTARAAGAPAAIVSPEQLGGNGGFSLRSVDASREVLDCVNTIDVDMSDPHLEDQLFALCFGSHGFTVARSNVSRGFSVESLYFTKDVGYSPFAFHQAYCFLPDADFADLLARSELAVDTGLAKRVPLGKPIFEHLLDCAEKSPMVEVLSPLPASLHQAHA